MRPIPILFLSDSPELPSGLARITRNLALHLSRRPEFRVGYLGVMGTGTSKLPFPVYQTQAASGMWGETTLNHVWRDFARGEQGIIMPVLDISRVGYIGAPELLGEESETGQFLAQHRSRFKLWGYFAVDAMNVGGRYCRYFTDLYARWDRRLWYTRWAYTLGAQAGLNGDWIPHGLRLETWKMHPRKDARKVFGSGLGEDELLLGVVATNQPRKDWGLTFGVARRLADIYDGKFHLWAHTDLPYSLPGNPRHWNLVALTHEFGLEGKVTVTQNLTNDELALRYAACDVTLAPGLGEGFCYPIIESLACGTPVVHGTYGGGAELIQNADWLFEPTALRVEGEYGLLRPVYEPETVVKSVMNALGANRQICRDMVAHLDWGKLWPSVWEKWFLGGLR